MQPGVFSLLRLLWVRPTNLFLLNKVVETSGCCDQTVRPLLDSLIKCSPLAVDGIRDGILRSTATNYRFRNPQPRPAMLEKSIRQCNIWCVADSRHGFTPEIWKAVCWKQIGPRYLKWPKKCSYLTWLALTTLKNHKIDTLQVFLRIDASD